MDMSTMTMTSSATASSMTATTIMGMDEMSMTFFVSTSTSLFSMAWTPDSAGQYTGTCICLIAFATIFRALLAIRVNFFDVLTVIRYRRGAGAIAPYATDVKSSIRPWRVQEAVLLSSMDVVLAGIGYLLIIAVMTMNFGYFLSVLASVFFGTMLFGHFMAHSAAH